MDLDGVIPSPSLVSLHHDKGHTSLGRIQTPVADNAGNIATSTSFELIDLALWVFGPRWRWRRR